MGMNVDMCVNNKAFCEKQPIVTEPEDVEKHAVSKSKTQYREPEQNRNLIIMSLTKIISNHFKRGHMQVQL